jgi:phosphoribosylformylglycinamidine cyclo-ligase
VPQLFRYIEARGGVPHDDMLRTFNMGIGLIIACADAERQQVIDRLLAAREQPISIGRVVPGDRDVRYMGPR